jgi:hypothetical protein
MGYIDGGLGKHVQGIVNPMEPKMKPMIGYFETSSPNASPPNPSTTNMQEHILLHMLLHLMICLR